MTTKAKLSITYLFQCLVCFLQFKSLCSEIVLGEETGEFDFDGFPGVRHQFAVQVGAGRVECFYQKLREGATFDLTYKCISFILQYLAKWFVSTLNATNNTKLVNNKAEK
ncbi:hypothetical protein CHS0354_001753 [Potamilus streckersoni]|uniref:GOLD domain-containing protein n=1 Tax=Potamilus streckersoni TaxID=2493646 RepID=A0AAE0SJ00_9BIVA|nr:hypothetical protein CHS0354_001753 [Potamilus streckersoni]